MKNEVNERSQTHKLAEYLQYLLPHWNVDCEYNKKLTDPKTLDFTGIVNGIRSILMRSTDENIANNDDLSPLKQELEYYENIAIASEDNVEAFNSLLFSVGRSDKKYIKKVFPDIIAHLRGTMENKVIIEAKREGNKDKKARLFDLIKLGLFTKLGGEYEYNAGYFIDIPKDIPSKFYVDFDRDSTLQMLVPDSNVWIVKIKPQP
ncbi:MAG: hypothetical protein FWG18_02595 [Alphaproteobacteria bacterium]|nr:hypothetical protein [Alphaproteobacteria bacterium]